MANDAMSPKDLRDRTDDELVTFVQEKSEELFKLRFQHYTGQLENTARLKTVRRELARARTIITERDKGIVVAVKPAEGGVGKVDAATSRDESADDDGEEEDEA